MRSVRQRRASEGESPATFSRYWGGSMRVEWLSGTWASDARPKLDDTLLAILPGLTGVAREFIERALELVDGFNKLTLPAAEEAARRSEKFEALAKAGK